MSGARPLFLRGHRVTEQPEPIDVDEARAAVVARDQAFMREQNDANPLPVTAQDFLPIPPDRIGWLEFAAYALVLVLSIWASDIWKWGWW